MVTEGLLINCSANDAFPIFRTVGRRTIPDMTGRFLDLAASGTLLVFGTGVRRTIPVMTGSLL